MHEIFQFLQWAVPGGIGGTVAWILSKRIRDTRNDKVVHDTYKVMYHDISNEIMQLRNENAKIIQQSDNIADESRALKRALQRLSKAIQDIQKAVQLCPYHSNCPVRSQLQDTPGGGDGNLTTQRLDTSLHNGNGANDNDHDAKRGGHRQNGTRHNHDPTTAAGGGMDDHQRQRNNHSQEDQLRDDHHRNSTKDAKGDREGQCTGTKPADTANTKQGHGKG